MKVLVGEDDKLVSLLVCGILRDEGHQTLAAYDQMQVLMFALKVPAPDAIVLDLNMPGGKGGETLRRLKSSARTAHIPVIVLTGTSDPSAPNLVRELGGESFMPKPVNRVQLLDELEWVTRRRVMVPAEMSSRKAALFTYE